jgi:hypothetical protein
MKTSKPLQTVEEERLDSWTWSAEFEDLSRQQMHTHYQCVFLGLNSMHHKVSKPTNSQNTTNPILNDIIKGKYDVREVYKRERCNKNQIFKGSKVFWHSKSTLDPK